MSRLLFNSRGISLVEVVIAIFLVTVGVLALLSMQPSAWRAVGKSDYLGRGAGIMHRELEHREAWIMNACNIVPVGNRPPKVITMSGMVGVVQGDATYTVNTTITPVAASPNAWTVSVTVTWADQVARGYRNLAESTVVTRQNGYSFPAGCINDTNVVLPGD